MARYVQDFVYRVLISILEGVSLRTAPGREDARIICDLVRAFDIILERIRILTMTPAPKAADPPKKPAKRLALPGPMVGEWKPREKPKPPQADMAP
jgi:hypothetical protein